MTNKAKYARSSVEYIQHRWYLDLAHLTATASATALAKGEMRLGNAHKYLISAHCQALLEGAGDQAFLTFLDDLKADLINGR